MTIEELIDDIIKKEGGYVNHPADKGGPTNFGITINTLSNYLGRKATIADVKRLKRATAIEIYKKVYYYGPNINLLPTALQPIIFDMAVNSGPSAAIKLLQRALFDKKYDVGEIDGKIGTRTIKCSNDWYAKEGKVAINILVSKRKQFYLNLIARDSSQKVFEKGWLARADSFIETV